MAFSLLTRTLLGSAVILTGVSFSAPPSHAGQVQLHELLFKRLKKKKEIVRPRVVKPSTAARKVVKKKPPVRKIKKIAGPRYYKYKSPKISTVTFGTLAAAAVAKKATTEAGHPHMDFETQRFKEALVQIPEGGFSVEPDIAEAVKAHYAEKPAFIWSRGTSVTSEAKDLVILLQNAADHGLNPANYNVVVPQDLFEDSSKRAAELLAFELRLSAHAIRYAKDMKDGAINPNLISGYHDFPGKKLSAKDAMAGLADEKISASEYAESLMPKQGHYAQLQSELKRLRTATDSEIVFPEKIFMKPGIEQESLPLLMKAMNRKMRAETREKHAETIANYNGSFDYEGKVVELVRDVQRDLGLVPDGIVGPKTIKQLGGVSLASKVKRVEMALERMRWHPEEYGERQVVINQPEYRVRYIENGKTELAMRVVVGKPANQTNFFHDEIETVVFNPYWGVPQSIIVNEMLPRLRRDPGYLDRAGYVVTSYSGKKIASSNINWAKYAGPVPYNVRQKPGPRNALGELKILFPNKHAIYMHDTPAKKLFARDSRAYSHGCVRLEDPRAMAAAVLGKDRSYITSKLGGAERAEKLSQKIPVYVSYFTAWPNDDGVVEYHSDVYKRDTYLGRAMDAVNTARNKSS